MKFIGAETAAAVPPPYSPPGVPGLVTVTGTVAVFMTALAGIVALTMVAATNVVFMGAPLNFTTAFELKLLPSTSRVKVELPIAVLGGTRLAIAGIVPGCWGIVAWLE